MLRRAGGILRRARGIRRRVGGLLGRRVSCVQPLAVPTNRAASAEVMGELGRLLQAFQPDGFRYWVRCRVTMLQTFHKHVDLAARGLPRVHAARKRTLAWRNKSWNTCWTWTWTLWRATMTWRPRRTMKLAAWTMKAVLMRLSSQLMVLPTALHVVRPAARKRTGHHRDCLPLVAFLAGHPSRDARRRRRVHRLPTQWHGLQVASVMRLPVYL